MAKKEVEWFEKPFYIQSLVGGENFCLTATENGDVAMRRLASSPQQMWQAIKDSRGSAFLKNIGAGKVLRALYIHDTFCPQVTLERQDADDKYQQWRLEDLNEGAFGVVCGWFWEMRLHIYAEDLKKGRIALYKWSRGAVNEKWNILVEQGVPVVKETTYHLDKASVKRDIPPSRTDQIEIDNTTEDTAFSGSRDITRTVTNTKSMTTTSTEGSGEKYTQTFGIKGGKEKVFEVSMSFGFEESKTRSFSTANQDTETETASDTLRINLNVPPRKRFGYSIVTRYGGVDVPYTSTLEFKSTVNPSLAPVRYKIEGVFKGVNAVSQEIVVEDLTPGRPKDRVEVARQELPRVAPKTVSQVTV